MRRVDEILSIFSSQTVGGKRFLLRSLERQPVTADASGTLEFIQAQQTEEAGDLARLAEDRFYARYTRDRMLRASGNRSHESGDWSRFFGQHPVNTQAERRNLERAAATDLANLVMGLNRCISADDFSARLALKVLSRIRVPDSLDAIESASASDKLALDAMAAFATFGGEAAAERALPLIRKAEGTARHPSMVAALRGLPCQGTFAYLGQLAAQASLGAEVAVALEGFEQFDLDPLLEPSLTGVDPWNTLQAVETLGRLGGAQRAERISQVLASAEHPLVQVACLQALATTESAKGGDAARKALEAPHPLVQAAAIEALISLPVPKGSYRDRVLRLLDAPNPRLAMNVALACVVLDSRRAAKRIHELLKQGSAAHLMQGIHCLAYMEHPSTAGILSALVKRSPSGPLRLQAVRALGRHAADNPAAVEALAGLLGVDDAEVRRTTAWFLASAESLARPQAVEALVTALEREPDAETRVVFLRALAIAGPAMTGTSERLSRYLDGEPELRQAAAYALAIGAPESAEAAGLEALEAAGAHPWGAVRSWFQSGQGLERLARAIIKGEGEERRAGLAVARMAAEVATFVDEPENLSGLAAALAARQAGRPPPPPPVPPPSSSSAPAPAPPPPPQAPADPVEVISSGVLDQKSFAVGGFEGVESQLVTGADMDDLPTEAEAGAAIEANPLSQSEVVDAVAAASYFAMDRNQLAKALEDAKARKAKEEKQAAAPPPPAPREDRPSTKLMFLVLLALFSGQLVRLYIFYY
jgi:HEAT repeat protein